MRKALLIAILVTLTIGSIFAATSERYTAYGNIVKSGTYTLTGTIYPANERGKITGDGVPITIAAQNGAYYMSTTVRGLPFKVLMRSYATALLLDDSTLTATPADPDDLDLIYLPTTFNYSRTGKGKLNDVSLTYEINQAEDDCVYWYSGNTLYAIQEKDDDEGYILVVSSLVPSSDPTLFEVPSTYYGQTPSYPTTTTSQPSGYATNVTNPNFTPNYYNDDDDEHFYAFALMMGLTDTAARRFSDMMTAFEQLEWEDLNRYYDPVSQLYYPNGLALSSLGNVPTWTADTITQMMTLFK